MFETFDEKTLRVNGVDVFAKVGGEGPPLLLLHGYPQTHVIWHRVAGELAKQFTVVAPDLRGYGASGKPPGGEGHINYSKREMARDQVELMRALGFDRFQVCGHDRGGRVAHRMAMDHPAAVERLMVLDIAPTLAMYEQTSMEFARAYWWWFWLIQPAPFPEEMVAAAPEVFLRKKIGWDRAGLAPFTDDTYAAYLKNVSDPATMHAMCEDYRAAASIDLEHDRQDRREGKMIRCPLAVQWGAHGVIDRCFQPLDEWRKVATSVTGGALACGHYIPEEVPENFLRCAAEFFKP